MAFANSSVSDIIATTIQQRSGKLADNVTNNDAALYMMKEKGNVRPFGGGNVILEEIMYNDTSTVTANSYSGYETINVAANSPISAEDIRPEGGIPVVGCDTAASGLGATGVPCVTSCPAASGSALPGCSPLSAMSLVPYSLASS